MQVTTAPLPEGKMKLDTLFSPTTLAGVALRNRIAMSPMTRSFSPSSLPGQDVVDYYTRRAAAGTGLIFTEGTYIAHTSSGDGAFIPRLESRTSVEAWRRVTDSVHAAGAPIFSQLWHIGISPTPGKKVDHSHRLIGPSGIQVDGTEVDKPMTDIEIASVIEAYGHSAACAKAAGFDGVEIHAGHGYLIDQFFWPRTNRRTDRFGGDLTARARFAAEVIAECRRTCGPGFPLSIRFSQWKIADYTARIVTTPAELETWLAPMVEAGIDIFHCSQRRFWEPEFEGSDLNLAGWTKKLTGKPTITVGSVTIPGEAEGLMAEPAAQLDRLEEMLARGDFDVVSVARAILQNPDWVGIVKRGALAELAAFDRAQAREVLY